MNTTFRLALAQSNLLVGNIGGNATIVLENIRLAKERYHSDLVIFPELALTGYPPEDLLYRASFSRKVAETIQSVCNYANDIGVVLGYPLIEHGSMFNACSLIKNGVIKHTYFKQNLPNYSVFDEKRYFQPGHEPCVFDLNGIPIALSICEDIWDKSVCEQAMQTGAKLMININASPYHIDKISLRKQILKQRVAETGMNIVYVNMVGGQDELVFDGGSMTIDNQGNIDFQAPQFEEGLYIIDFTLDENSHFSTPIEYPIQNISREESIYQALVLGVRDYVRKNGFSGTIIGLSGGIDSALTLCIAVDALGKDNVEAVIMPSRYTSAMSMEDARSMVKLLGVKSHIISIEKPFGAFTECLQPVFENLPVDSTEENIQSRCRGILLMAISNKTGKLVLTTGNKSEMSVGYATLYGDMAGGFAPLKDVSKTLVYKLGNWRNQQSHVIPQRIIDRPPTAELRENQLDQDSLPPYDILDPILERYIEHDQSPVEIIKAGYDEETVKKVVLMVDRNEYKRRQAAPGVRITQRAFGRDRRYPITSGYRE
jgi:NAD+ synthase (glutamine-hydrolysing)